MTTPERQMLLSDTHDCNESPHDALGFDCESAHAESRVDLPIPRFHKPREGSPYYSVGALHFTYAKREDILDERRCGRYRVQIFKSFGTLVHQVVLDTTEGPLCVRAVTRSEETVYPKNAGLLGNRMIEDYKRRQASEIV